MSKIKTPEGMKVPESASSTVIGENVVIKGRLRSGEDLVIRGRIEAEISSDKALFVETSGVVKANVSVRNARVSGTVVGDILAKEKIEIAPEGRVVGDLTSPRIVISDGAAFKGKIDMPAADQMAARIDKASTDGPTAPTLSKGARPAGGTQAPDYDPPGDRKGPHRSPSTATGTGTGTGTKR